MNLELKKYIEQAQSSGVDNTEIRQTLVSVGWSIEEVDQALSVTNTSAIRTGKYRKPLLVVTILLVLLPIIVISAFYVPTLISRIKATPTTTITMPPELTTTASPLSIQTPIPSASLIIIPAVIPKKIVKKKSKIADTGCLYKSPKGFSFNYPCNWQLNPGLLEIGAPELLRYSDFTQNEGKNYYTVGVFYNPAPGGIMSKLPPTDLKAVFFDPVNCQAPNCVQDTVIVDGQKAERQIITNTNKGGGQHRAIDLLIPKASVINDGLTLNIICDGVASTPSCQSKIDPVLNDIIIPSFKFIAPFPPEKPYIYSF